MRFCGHKQWLLPPPPSTSVVIALESGFTDKEVLLCDGVPECWGCHFQSAVISASEKAQEFWLCIFGNVWFATLSLTLFDLKGLSLYKRFLRNMTMWRWGLGAANSQATDHIPLRQSCSFTKENTHSRHVRAWCLADVNCACDVWRCRSHSFLAQCEVVRDDRKGLSGCVMGLPFYQATCHHPMDMGQSPHHYWEGGHSPGA